MNRKRRRRLRLKEIGKKRKSREEQRELFTKLRERIYNEQLEKNKDKNHKSIFSRISDTYNAIVFHIM